MGEAENAADHLEPAESERVLEQRSQEPPALGVERGFVLRRGEQAGDKRLASLACRHSARKRS